MSARTVERSIDDIAEHVRAQQTAGIKNAAGFNIVCDESVNDIPHLPVMARYFNSTVREELCCLKPMSDTTKSEDIARVLLEHFEVRGLTSGRFLQ